MKKTTRNLVAGLAVMMVTAGTVRIAAASETAETIADPWRRVRTSHPVMARLIQEATQRSATFRGLMETIRNSDGIVYVEHGDCGRAIRACLVTVTAAGHRRILVVKVRVDPRKADWDLMGLIGHELRHAIEVLSDPTVNSSAAMYFFYERVGLRLPHGFETDAAVNAGDQVRREARRRS